MLAYVIVSGRGGFCRCFNVECGGKVLRGFERKRNLDVVEFEFDNYGE